MASKGSTATADKKAKGKSSAKQSWESRAVTRLIEAGCAAECPKCEERVKYRARHRDQQVICNVYDKGVWQRVEQYHAECYTEAGEPYGEPE